MLICGPPTAISQCLQIFLFERFQLTPLGRLSICQILGGFGGVLVFDNLVGKGFENYFGVLLCGRISG